MSTAFHEFLHAQSAKHQGGKETIEEWRSAVDKLFTDIKSWLRESDPEGLIEIEETQQLIGEPGLGHYRIPRLNLRAFGKWVGVIPKARKTVGSAKPPQKSAPERAEGRVDITDELRRYVLYRFKENGRDVWLIDGLDRGYEEKEFPTQVQFVPRSDPRPFDQEAFEKALMSYLQ